ncbi:MAG: ATP-binding protein [Lachnospiraceae bacterium]
MNVIIWTYVEAAVTLWAACMLYLVPLKRRSNYGIRILLSTVGICVMAAAAGVLGISCPVLTVSHFLICFLFIYTCAAMPFGAAVYCVSWVIITQQIAQEIVFIVLNNRKVPDLFLTVGCTLVIFVVIYGAAGVTVVRYMPEDGVYQVGPRQFFSALFLFAVFESLFGFLQTIKVMPLPDVQIWIILLIQCYCVLILYLQNTLFKKSAMKQELDTLNQLWHQQKEQYELSRETIALINHKCHDLKHQIAAMRAITSPEEREKYLREVEDSVQIYDLMVKTGNEVLDTVLTEKSLSCAANNIKINCIADGGQMDIFDPVDLYTVFGNAIDNAIESVKQLANEEMRMVDVLVYVRKQFLLINIMNPIGNRLEFDGDLPISTKTRNGYHGFGLKSIRHIIEKYNGFMKIDMAEDIFSLKILIPITENKRT